jgi:lysophospholipase L1-like esterase
LAHAGASYLAVLLGYVLWQPADWKRRLARSGLNVAAVLLATALIELPALVGLVDYRRVLIPRVLGGTGPHNRQMDPELIYRHLPHDRFVHYQAGDFAAGLALPTSRRYRAEVVCDANGFRNRTDFTQADVVLLGDSFIEGYNVTQSDICSEQLARRLTGQTVCNLALCGFGPQQELIALRKYGLPLRPQTVVWFFYEGNDLSDTEEYEEMVADWPKHVAEERSFAVRSFFSNLLDPLGFWLDQLRWRPSEFARRRTGEFSPEIPGETRTTYFGGPPFPMNEHFVAVFDKVQRMFDEARAACDAGHVRLLMVHVPTKGRVCRDLCTFPPDSDVPHWQFNDLPERLGAWCKRSGVEYLDLTPALQAAARQGRLVYLVDDPHWTADGHAVAAEEVARRLQHQSPSPSGRGPG